MAIKKFDFKNLKEKFSDSAEYKPQRFFDLGEVFLDATSVPGPAMGHINMFLGHSDTGKSTALIKTAIDAQKKNILPVFIITEQKWDFNHAKLMGFEVTEVVDENGNTKYDGDFLFNNNFKYIEQITDYINKLLDEQEKGNVPYDLLFLCDSIGSVPCKMTYEGKGGKQHNAAVLADKIGMGINQRISGSRKKDSKYTNTLVIINQPWVELPDNPYSQAKIKPKGGEAVYLNSTLVFLFGSQKGSGTSKINLTKNKRKVNIGSRTKISVIKNHVNGIEFADGRLMVTPKDFMFARTPEEEKKSKAKFISENLDYISYLFGGEVVSPEELEVSEDPSFFMDSE